MAGLVVERLPNLLLIRILMGWSATYKYFFLLSSINDIKKIYSKILLYQSNDDSDIMTSHYDPKKATLVSRLIIIITSHKVSPFI